MLPLQASIRGLAVCLCCISFAHGTDRRRTAEAELDDLTRFTKYAFGAYLPLCSNPLGNPLVQQWNDKSTDTQAYLARDDTRKEIVAVFRGSSSIRDFITDGTYTLVQFDSPGTDPDALDGVQVHRGFLAAFNSIASVLLSNVSSQLKQYPTYSLVSTGHSLGGALASLGAVSMASNFPGVPLKMYTFGQPRTGNVAYAQLAETYVGSHNIYRAVNTFDGVPTMVPTMLGYNHHSTEYWFFKDPSNNANNFKKCVGAEDPTCSDSILSSGINLAHLSYCGEELYQTSIC